MTLLRIWTDQHDHTLNRELAEAPWREAAGITLVESGEDAVLVYLSAPDSWADWMRSASRRPSADPVPIIVAGPGLSAADAGSPVHEVRMRAQALGEPLDLVVQDQVLQLPSEFAADSPDPHRVWATANIGFTDIPIAVSAMTQSWTVLGVGTQSTTWTQPAFLRLVHRLLHEVTHRPKPTTTRIGLLGYGAIGHEHAGAIEAVDGLELAMVCDTQSVRLNAAADFTPGIRTTSDPDALLGDEDIDLIVVSTPPNTHADWALRILDHGKHVVLEKPMALTTAECDAVIARANEHDLLAVVYQNRRFDPDFIAINDVIQRNELGQVFHLESFVGTHQHPCNYWHSDRQVSGGALFDWGSHVIDQVLQLMPGEVSYVTAMNHKRRWHDVTNADHARMTLHYEDGREASFIYSDLAAALKPRWYLAGTHGGLIGDWRNERVVSRSPIGTLSEDLLAAADSPPVLTLFDDRGRETKVPGIPPAPHAFHAELAAYLRDGLPMQVTADQSRRVVAMLEAAEISAARNGKPVTPA